MEDQTYMEIMKRLAVLQFLKEQSHKIISEIEELEKQKKTEKP